VTKKIDDLEENFATYANAVEKYIKFMKSTQL